MYFYTRIHLFFNYLQFFEISINAPLTYNGDFIGRIICKIIIKVSYINWLKNLILLFYYK